MNTYCKEILAQLTIYLVENSTLTNNWILLTNKFSQSNKNIRKSNIRKIIHKEKLVYSKIIIVYRFKRAKNNQQRAVNKINMITQINKKKKIFK